jgi:hypothetical protein
VGHIARRWVGLRAGETADGTDDIWWILEGQDYPRLWWELAEE